MWLCAECDYVNSDSRPICDGCYYRYDTFRISIRSAEAIDVFNAKNECDIEHNIYLLRCNRLDYLIGCKRIEGSIVPMTPQEELFASFFNDERALIKDMDTLELRAHREGLAKIAFEARARLTAVDDEERSRRAKKDKDGKPKGFSTSLQTDELTSDAINKITERKKKMSKAEKTLEGLKKLGIDVKEAEKIMSAGTILARVRANEAKANSEPEPATNFSNPFKPQTEELAQQIEVAIIEENTIVVTKKEEVKSVNPSFNPFAKS